MSVVNDLIARYGPAQTVTLLNSQVTSAQAVAAGIPVPYPNFTNPAVQVSRTVAQALRAYPQYLRLNVQVGGGDKTGKSRYRAAVLKMDQRLSGGITMQGSYAFSRIMTDADSFNGSGGSLDAARPELEWGRGIFDVPHSFKLSTVIQLPFGEGRRWLNSGIGNQILGGWRVAVIQSYFFRQTNRRDEQRAPSDFRSHESPERDGRRLAGANSRRGVQPPRRPVPESGGVCSARRRIGQCSTHQPRCADAGGDRRKRQPCEIAETGFIARRYPGGGFQRVQSRPLGNACHELQLEYIWPDHHTRE